MLLRPPRTHVDPGVRQNRLCSHYVDAINLSQISPRNPVEFASQVKCWSIPVRALPLRGLGRKLMSHSTWPGILFRCCSIRLVTALYLLLICPVECEVLFHDENQFLAPVPK